MKLLSPLFAGIIFAHGLLGFAAVDSSPDLPLGLALSVNDAASATVYRGWPLILRGDAALMDDVAAPVVLDVASLNLAIAPANGPALSWPLKRVTELGTTLTLGPANESARVVWVLTPEQSSGIRPGVYSATLTWAGKKSPPLRFTVADAPAVLTANDESRRALLLSELAQLSGDAAAALAALAPAIARQPDAIDLLVAKAQIHQQRGEFADALAASQHALEVFRRDFPQAGHPPIGILEVHSRALAGWLKNSSVSPPVVSSSSNSTPAPPPGAPGVPAPAAAIVSPNPGVAPANLPPASAGGSTDGVIVPTSDLIDAKIIGDPTGQWAVTATASSQYGPSKYAPAQATGAPNIGLGMAGDNPDAWCPVNKNNGTEWLEVSFAKPVHATEVRVRQNNAPGAIAKIEAIEPDGTTHVWWAGVDPYKQPAIREIVWFAIHVPQTPYLVAKVRITLNLATVSGWKQIDAVQLVGP